MTDSREASPDWLRSFQAPTQSITTLSSDSEPSGVRSAARDDSINLHGNAKHKTSDLMESDGEEDVKIGDIAIKSGIKSSNNKTTKRRVKVGDETPAKRRKTEKHDRKGSADDENVKREESFDKPMETPLTATNHSVWALSSDSESDTDSTTKVEEANEESSAHELLELIKKEEKNDNEDSASKVAVKGKSPKKRMKLGDFKPTEKKKTSDPLKIEGEVGDTDVAEEGVPQKQVEPRVSSSTLPLVISEKVCRSKALVECEGESIDLSGDMGAVGRVIIQETPSKEPEMFLDLKGTIYKTTIVPSRTFCVVSIGQSEAKIEAIMNDFIQLKPQSNVYDAETMVEGTLEGFSFDSEDEADKIAKEVKGDQNEGAEEQPNKKTKGKAEKKKGATQKKAKAVGGKQPQKRKPQAPKKGKAKK